MAQTVTQGTQVPPLGREGPLEEQREPIAVSAPPFSSCLQSFPASGSFPVNQFFSSGGQSSGASASSPVLPMNIEGWFPLWWTGCSSLQSKCGLFASMKRQKAGNPYSIKLRKFPSISSLFRVLNHRWVLNFDKSFSAFTKIIARFFPLYFDNVVNQKGWVSNIKPTTFLLSTSYLWAL